MCQGLNRGEFQKPMDKGFGRGEKPFTTHKALCANGLAVVNAKNPFTTVQALCAKALGVVNFHPLRGMLAEVPQHPRGAGTEAAVSAKTKEPRR